MAISKSNGKTVLVTGINGFIASVLGLRLLEKGYSLRGTTRHFASSEALLQGPYALYKERVKIYEVPDITVDGAFDEAAEGVHGIFHTASPVSSVLDAFEKTIIPAVRGTETLLFSALKSGSQLSSVVVTSSVAAISNPSVEPGHVFTESEFASFAFDRAMSDHKEGLKTPPGILYSASKTAADRATWKFRNEHKPSFAISTVNPSVVAGPPVALPASGPELNETLLPVYKLLSGTAREIPQNIGSGSFVDVRDVAAIHIWVYENSEQADGERYIACAGYGPYQAAADILHQKYRGTRTAEKIVVGTPGEGYLGFNKETGDVDVVAYPPGVTQASGKKAEREVGFKYITFQQSISDTADVLEALVRL